MREIVNALKFLLKSLAFLLISSVASFKALGNFTPKMRSGAFLNSDPSVNLVHWYFNAPLKVAAKPWLKFLVVAGFRLSCDLSVVLKKLVKPARYCLEFVNLGVC
ncbi:hypothetical protein MLS218_09150 [Helicobacter pylori]